MSWHVYCEQGKFLKSNLEKIGAKLDVSTKEEEGTTFTIDISKKKGRTPS